jgi:uncharacterized membrane protein YsdA (DUF1294 family)/cold shock CspA family protein
MRIKGKITSWNDEKGYGFITPIGGGERVFVHIKAFSNRARRPEPNQIVSYALTTDQQGRPCAEKATLAGDRLRDKSKNKSNSVSLFSIIAFLVIISFFVLKGKITSLILAFYVAVSLVTFIMYYVDKSAAKKGDGRIPENSLHVISLVGGWPGALIAQQWLRHKSRKQPFRFIFWITVLLNCGALDWLTTQTDTSILQTLFAGVA